eukprot:scaffold104484_cov25-Tisochrysis_lutea.AAC.2
MRADAAVVRLMGRQWQDARSFLLMHLCPAAASLRKKAGSPVVCAVKLHTYRTRRKLNACRSCQENDSAEGRAPDKARPWRSSLMTLLPSRLQVMPGQEQAPFDADPAAD